jgi:mutual gliding-motility protein MglA
MQVNHARRAIHLKLVYAGGPESGKTANLEYLYQNAEQSVEGGIESIRDSNDHTLLFDFAPFNCRKVHGYDVRFFIYTLPSRLDLETPRELGFNGMDGMVLVIDSRWSSVEENLKYYEGMRHALESNQVDLSRMPHVIQYNRRDDSDVAPIHYLQYVFNRFSAPFYEGSCVTGTGIFETLNGIARRVLKHVLQTAFRKSGDLPEFAKTW